MEKFYEELCEKQRELIEEYKKTLIQLRDKNLNLEFELFSIKLKYLYKKHE